MLAVKMRRFQNFRASREANGVLSEEVLENFAGAYVGRLRASQMRNIGPETRHSRDDFSCSFIVCLSRPKVMVGLLCRYGPL